MNDAEQIAEMLKTFDEPGNEPEEPTPEVEAKAEVETEVKEPEKEEEVKEDEDSKESDSEEVVPSVETKADIQEPDKGTDEADPRDQEIADLRAKLAEVTASKKEEPKPPEPPKIEDQNFLENLDLDDISRDPAEFNKVLNSIYKKARTDTQAEIAKTLPEMIREHITAVNALQAATDQFYAENPDLQSFKQVASVVFQELANANPERTFNDVMKDVAPEVRKRLGLKPPSKKPEPKKEVAPKLPKKGGSGNSRSSELPQVDPLMAELEAMNKALNS